MMNHTIQQTIGNILSDLDISDDRKVLLAPLVTYIQEQVKHSNPVNLQFICTHNSRRSILAQVWTSIAADHFRIPLIKCFSGGTEETAVYPKIVETLRNQGLLLKKNEDEVNPIYELDLPEKKVQLKLFSKVYNHPLNPKTNFAAIMTCSQADAGCPFIPGADTRIPITYADPKSSDGTDIQDTVYWEKSLEIAQEMFYVFSKVVDCYELMHQKT
ncbi:MULTISPECIES: protein-tyrosine-phosphatase [Sphingobacterium]|uniref:Protein-tyrosine-phosphatase n=1 Tax=Sphingobacterium tenebrionis TaxID=3111775 RepID=A0ABU8I263_9SPHI|nr:protein-tyrosine-phosphatase [Sphingobacterium sp. CZ-2]